MEDNKDKILAVVNGEEIKQSEVDNFIQALGYRGAQFNNEEGRKRLTDELINRKLLFFDAKKTGLDKDEIYVKEVKKQSEELLKDFAMANIINSVRVSDDELKEYYESHKDNFKVQPDIHKKSSILFLDGFQVWDKNGADITKSFTPILKQLLILIILYSVNNKKGISNVTLRELLWFDKTDESAQNNRRVNI